ncbi:MAG: polyphosphate kinase 1 [Acaryochloridaceae cyanobacterium CSU_5_19]|nr:polyphosphate kinase 1 [Acaryochloridaceae cyanobacterium CSU_5_19]
MLVHHPYESFTATVQQFIAQAAHDPNVLTIKMTLYRTDGDAGLGGSPIVSSLIAAAENGKQVVALVELKARFDEQNNIGWAKKLENVGVHVVYGLVGLKTHTKTALVVRREGKQLRRYIHIGTGNYNPKTARLYTDLGLLSCREELGADLTDLFNYLTGFSRHQSYRKLWIAPVNLRNNLLELIEREIDHQRQGNRGRIIAKMNSLVDFKLMRALYRASQAGVKIDLIVRGICSLKPGLPGLSENIHVISIVGRFLEHDRIFYFHNQGQPSILIGSADWRTRNLDRRVEAVVPIEDPALVAQLRELLELMLTDNCLAWDLQPDGNYIQRQPGPDQPLRSIHQILMQRAAHHQGTLINDE